MSSPRPSTARPSPPAQLIRWFFANFFRLLLLAVSFAEWALLWWLVAPHVNIPTAFHLLGPTLIYAVNRWMMLRARQPSLARHGIERLPRLYYSIAFTCLFCAIFLLINGTIWSALELLAGSVAAAGGNGGTVAPLAGASRWSGLLGVTAISLAFAYGYTVGQKRLVVRHLRLNLANVPLAWHGLRIAQISDIHLGANLAAEELKRFVAAVNQLQPDLICITGDIVDSGASNLPLFLPLLAELHAAHGVFAILGNHDHYAGAERVAEALRELTAFTVLRDETARITIRGHDLHVLGLDDRGRDWARGLSHVPQLDELHAQLPVDQPKLLLCHRPDIFPHAAATGVALTLSGHTHGGQLAVPWFGGRYRNLAEFITGYDRGLFENNGAFLYVNCGLGVTGQRIRLCTPREITLIEVAGAVDAEAA